VSAASRTGEGAVQILDTSGASRLKRSFASADGEHGLTIVQASWTPNSEFFVFSGSSSGGHRPWHSPLFVYSRAGNTIYELDKCVPGIVVVEPEFQIVSASIVRLTVATFSADHGLAEHHRSEAYDLSDVVRSMPTEGGLRSRTRLRVQIDSRSRFCWKVA